MTRMRWRTLPWPRAARAALAFGLDAIYLYALLAGELWTWPFVVAGFWAIGALAALRLSAVRGCTRADACLFPLCALLPLTALRRVTTVVEPARGVTAPAVSDRPRRAGLAALLVLVIAGSATDFAGERVVDPVLAPVDERTTDYLERTLVRAGASFAMARGIDRAVAVVANAEVSPVGFALQPGQLFKPIQDMAVRFADVMVVVMAVVGTELVLTRIAGHVAVPVFASAVAGLLLASLLLPGERARPLVRLAGGVAVVGLLLRLLVPVVALATSAIAGTVLDDRRDAIEEDIGVPAEARADVGAEPADDDGVTAFLWRLREQLGDSVSTTASFTDDIVGQLVDLTVIYLVEVIVAPLGVIAILYYLYRRTRAAPRASDG